MNQYEAMFLFDPTFGSSFEKCEAEVRRLMERAQAETLLCRKWDERRLAYKVKGRKRGVYVLVYFKAPPDRIGALERDVQISEDVLRVLIIRAEGVTREMMERGGSVAVASDAGTPAAPKPTAALTEPKGEVVVKDADPTGVSDADTEPKTEPIGSDSELSS